MSEEAKALNEAAFQLGVASQRLADARRKSAEAFLLAKLSSRKPTDRQAEASAEVEAGSDLLAAETKYFAVKLLYAAAVDQCL